MRHRIVAAHARPDHTVAIVWGDGAESVVNFAGIVARGEVCRLMRDPRYFAERLTVGGEGDWLAWDDVDFCADSLRLRARL